MEKQKMLRLVVNMRSKNWKFSGWIQLVTSQVLKNHKSNVFYNKFMRYSGFSNKKQIIM